MVLGFGKGKVKVHRTNVGSHGNHWQAIFGFGEGIDTHACVQSMWEDVGIEKEIDRNHLTVRAQYGMFSLFGIQTGDQISTLFPALDSTESIPLEIIEIVEWAHTDGSEGQVLGAYGDTPLQIVFFATDYLEKRPFCRRQGIG